MAGFSAAGEHGSPASLLALVLLRSFDALTAGFLTALSSEAVDE
jgi:hypothetical protein